MLLPLPEIDRGASMEIPELPMHRIAAPRGFAISGATRERGGAAPSSVPERVSRIQTPATDAERIPPAEIKPAENPRPEMAMNSSPALKTPEITANPVRSITVIPDLYPTIRTPSDSKSPVPLSSTSLRIGRLVSRVEPVYPPEALRQRIAGTVKIHVLIARDGTVARVDLLEGPAFLTEAARVAVQQWTYEPTLLGGEPVEAEENISIVFRIDSPTPASN
jgi:TonB family protein